MISTPLSHYLSPFLPHFSAGLFPCPPPLLPPPPNLVMAIATPLPTSPHTLPPSPLALAPLAAASFPPPHSPLHFSASAFAPAFALSVQFFKSSVIRPSLRCPPPYNSSFYSVFYILVLLLQFLVYVFRSSSSTFISFIIFSYISSPPSLYPRSFSAYSS